MKRIMIVLAFAILSLPLSAQFGGIDVEGMVHNPNQYIGQQQKEIGNTIKSDVEAQIKQRQTQTTQSQIQTRQNQTQTARQQAIESYTNKMSIEGQIRMEHINNPDVYIDRSITNRNPSLNANSTNSTSKYNSSNQSSDLRTRPIHNEELTSKSLQMLREANREYFSNENEAEKANADVYVQLFEHPHISERPLVEKPNLMQWAWNEHARQMKLKNEVDKNNDMIDMTKKGLGIIGGIVTKSMTSVEVFLVSANLNLCSELVKYWNECSSGARTSEGIYDTFDILKKATVNTAVDFFAPWVGDKAGAAYLGLEYAGTHSWGMLNSVQISLTLSDFAVNDDKHEE